MTAALWRLLRALQRISCVAKITLTRHQQSAKRRACAKFSATVHNEQHLLRGTRGAALRTGYLGGKSSDSCANPRSAPFRAPAVQKSQVRGWRGTTGAGTVPMSRRTTTAGVYSNSV